MLRARHNTKFEREVRSAAVDRVLGRWHALAGRLRRLPPRLQFAFAAGCADRALPVLEYEGYSDAPAFLLAFRAAIEVVWQAATRGGVPPEQVAHARGTVQEVFPEGDHYAGYGNTVSAGAGVLRAL